MGENNSWTVEDQIRDTRVGRPHLVILGAGASKAAFPHGDKNGRQIPLMDNKFVEIVGLESVLKQYGISYDGVGFEELYSDISDKPELADARVGIEKIVREYFESLEMPDHPTLYDHLILSLREKDIIATFNWDPFLWQACCRNYNIAKLPETLFLHGSVAVGVDLENKLKGPVGGYSKSTGKKFEPTPILFPIKKKDYSSDPYITAEWSRLKEAIEKAYVLTIFGYGAPKSDVEAIQAMKEAWGDVEKREYEETEIIDIKDDESLRETWGGFIHTHHYQVHDSIYDSTIGSYPRRSCESVWNRTMEVKWTTPNPIPKNCDFEQLKTWFKKLTDHE